MIQWCTQSLRGVSLPKSGFPCCYSQGLACVVQFCKLCSPSGRSNPSSILSESLTAWAWSKTKKRKQTMIVKCLSEPSLISPKSIMFHACLCSATRGGSCYFTCGIICSLSVFSHKSINSTNKGYLLGKLASLLEILQGVPDTWDIKFVKTRKNSLNEQKYVQIKEWLHTVYKPKSKEMHAWKMGEERGLCHVSG